MSQERTLMPGPLVAIRDYPYRELGEADIELLQKAGIEAYLKRSNHYHAALMVAPADAHRALELLEGAPQLVAPTTSGIVRCPRCESEQIQPRRPYSLIALIAGIGVVILAIWFGYTDAAAVVCVVMTLVIVAIEVRIPRYTCMSCYRQFKSGAESTGPDRL